MLAYQYHGTCCAQCYPWQNCLEERMCQYFINGTIAPTQMCHIMFDTGQKIFTLTTMNHVRYKSNMSPIQSLITSKTISVHMTQSEKLTLSFGF